MIKKFRAITYYTTRISKLYSTKYFLEITRPIIGKAWLCLTSLIERELVFLSDMALGLGLDVFNNQIVTN